MSTWMWLTPLTPISIYIDEIQNYNLYNIEQYKYNLVFYKTVYANSEKAMAVLFLLDRVVDTMWRR